MKAPPFWLILRTLVHQRGQTLAMLAMASLATGIILGSLVTGDSMDHTLRRQALDRVGRADVALIGGDRLFRPELAVDLERAAQADGGREVHAAGVFTTVASASSQRGAQRINQVQVLGVDEAISALTLSGEFPVELLQADDSLPPQVVVNDILAQRLNITLGDEVILRPRGPSELPEDAPLAASERETAPVRAKVAAVIGAEQYGRFSLYQTQEPPALVFMTRKALLEVLEEEPAANLLLLGAASGEPVSPEEAESWLSTSWKLADLSLRLDRLDQTETWEISSRRVFLESRILGNIQQSIPESFPVLSYFVNGIEHGDATTPFSFIAAVDPRSVPFLPDDMEDGTFVPNRWLADDLGLSEGDPLQLRFFVSETGGGLRESGAEFVAGPMLPMEGASADSEWTPEFPGLSTAEDCDDWETSLPIDVNEIREKDEEYWDEWRSTPKGFITFTRGRELWSNRWGVATAIRFPGDRSKEEITEEVRKVLHPVDGGLSFSPFRETALRASRASVDFGGLMVGFGFFVIVASVALTGLLFALSVDQRAGQLGLLRAVGWQSRQIRFLMVTEVVLISLLASLAGVPLGLLLARGLMSWIEGLWPVSGGLNLIFACETSSLLSAVGMGVVLPVLAVGWTIRRASRLPPCALLAGETPSTEATRSVGKGRRGWWIATLVLALASASTLFLGLRDPMAPGAFFAGAFFLVTTGLAAFRWSLAHFDEDHMASRLGALGYRESARNPWRSLSVAGTLAAGTFLVVASSAFRKQASEDLKPEGPTGGFEFIAETMSPVMDSLENAYLPEGTVIVGMRVRAGSDTSCLNMGSVQQPMLLGVDPASMEGRFSFTASQSEAPTWTSVFSQSVEKGDPLPAVVDETTLMWSLKASLGDHYTLTDEFGEPFDIVFTAALSAGMLQGGLLLPETALLEHFPSLSGDRLFLVDLLEGSEVEALRQRLNQTYREAGIETRLSWERLQSYNAIENTYISMFQVLGGLGLLLATVGVGLVAARNLRERLPEYALLSAIGWTDDRIRRLARTELYLCIAWGLGVGVAASALAVWPQGSAISADEHSWNLIGLLVLGILVGSVLTVRLAVAGLKPGQDILQHLTAS